MDLQLPPEFINKYKELLGERFLEFKKSLFEDPIGGFRLNPLKEDFQQVDIPLTEPIEYSPIGYYGDINGNSIDHISGYLYSQDPSAMYVAEVLDPKPNEHVLDLCAAPGSKSTYLASKMENTGILIANEINNGRAKVLSSNIERMGITNSIVTNNSPDQLVDSFTNYFDKIVVDAPCSGEGMFRKDPDATKYWSQDYVEQCAVRQKDILNKAYKMLKPGGTIVYSTCTFSPEEDELTALWFADTFNLEIANIKKYSGMESGKPEWVKNDSRANNFLRMFPDQFNGEGHFISKFIKSSSELTTTTNLESKISNIDNMNKKLFTSFIKNNLELDFPIICQNRDNLEASIIDVAKLNKVRVLRNGLRLGTFKKNRFEPNHALVVALSKNELKSTYELDDLQYKKFIHGEVIRIDEELQSQWVGVSYHQKIFSWGKFSNKTIKNFFPKGLRL